MSEWTFQLELVPDHAIPQFKRLRYHRVDITLGDIFQRGIHPQSALLDDRERVQTGAPEVILGKLNAEPAHAAALKAHNLGGEISVPPATTMDSRTTRSSGCCGTCRNGSISSMTSVTSNWSRSPSPNCAGTGRTRPPRK